MILKLDYVNNIGRPWKFSFTFSVTLEIFCDFRNMNGFLSDKGDIIIYYYWY